MSTDVKDCADDGPFGSASGIPPLSSFGRRARPLAEHPKAAEAGGRAPARVRQPQRLFKVAQDPLTWDVGGGGSLPDENQQGIVPSRRDPLAADAASIGKSSRAWIER